MHTRHHIFLYFRVREFRRLQDLASVNATVHQDARRVYLALAVSLRTDLNTTVGGVALEQHVTCRNREQIGALFFQAGGRGMEEVWRDVWGGCFAFDYFCTIIDL